VAKTPPPSITQVDVTTHRFRVTPGALAATTTKALVAAEGRRLGQLFATTVRRTLKTPSIAILYGSERQLLAYASSTTDFLVLELPKHMRAYDRRAAGVALPIVTIQGFQFLRMTRRRTSGHVTGSFAEAMFVWILKRLGLATSRDVRRITQTRPGLVGDVCPDFLVWRTGQWIPCESKHVASERYVRRPANRGFTQVVSAMAGTGATNGYLFVAIDGPANGARYRAELVELHV
jgi:hypothetical protein